MELQRMRGTAGRDEGKRAGGADFGRTAAGRRERGVEAFAKRDANGGVDPNIYVLPDRVVVATYGIPYLGYLVGLVQTPIGWAMLIALPAIALSATTLWHLWVGESRITSDPIPAGSGDGGFA